MAQLAWVRAGGVRGEVVHADAEPVEAEPGAAVEHAGELPGADGIHLAKADGLAVSVA